MTSPTTTATWTRGTPIRTRRSFISAIHAAEHDVERADDRDESGDQVPAGHLRQRLEADEAGGAEPAPPGRVRAVADEIDPLLAARAFRDMVDLAADGRLQPLGDLRANVAARHPLERLEHDPPRLA